VPLRSTSLGKIHYVACLTVCEPDGIVSYSERIRARATPLAQERNVAVRQR
jgi:hypothetical protein